MTFNNIDDLIKALNYSNNREELKGFTDFFYSLTLHLDNIKVFYLPTAAQENFPNKNVKIYIKTAVFKTILLCIIW